MKGKSSAGYYPRLSLGRKSKRGDRGRRNQGETLWEIANKHSREGYFELCPARLGRRELGG